MIHDVQEEPRCGRAWCTLDPCHLGPCSDQKGRKEWERPRRLSRMIEGIVRRTLDADIEVTAKEAAAVAEAAKAAAMAILDGGGLMLLSDGKEIYRLDDKA